MPTLRDMLQYEPVELGFGTSGLRGLVNDMTDLECYINTLGFLMFLAELDGSQTAGGTVYIAGDLRHSTPRIMAAVWQAVQDAGLTPVNCGFIPTPAVAGYALSRHAPCIMVTGSHIPDDRNGIKFYRADGELLKADELAVKTAVAAVRSDIYARHADGAQFDAAGALQALPSLPPADSSAREHYRRRFQDVFASDTLVGKKIVFYQHSAVGRDLLVEILEALGAEVVPVGRSEKFIPIDTENVTPDDQAYFAQLAIEHPDAFAIVSTDGDSDRPFVIDHTGVFHRGDVLGAVVADWLHADVAAAPLTVSDAVDMYLKGRMEFTHTKVGSPYVVSAMQTARAAGKQRVVGWEVNGGFMTGSDIDIDGQILTALPTRDALLPIIGALVAATDVDDLLDEFFGRLPHRATQAGMINDFPTEASKALIARFSQDTEATRLELATYFRPELGFGKVTKIVALDGVRIFFDNGDITHMRPSGNAPQLRCYSVADTQERADQIVAQAIAEPDGIFRAMAKSLSI